MGGVIGCSPDSFTLFELITATESRLKFDFDRAAHVMAALSSKPVNPRELNPYRKAKSGYTVADLERGHRAMAAGGRIMELTITMDQVVQ